MKYDEVQRMMKYNEFIKDHNELRTIIITMNLKDNHRIFEKTLIPIHLKFVVIFLKIRCT